MDEEHKSDIFFNGLMKEMKEVIKMKEPKTLPDHIEAVIKMEDSEFCKLIAGGKQSDNKGTKQQVSNQSRSFTITGNQNWKKKQTSAESGSKPWDKPSTVKPT